MIPTDAKKITVLISGGIDSTLLLYMLAKEIYETQSQTHLDCVSFRGGSVDVKQIKPIIEYIQNKFSTNITYNHSAPRRWIRDVVREVFEVCGSDYVFTGCNKVIVDEFFPTKHIPGDTPPDRGESFNERHIRPFIEWDKKEIIQYYIKHDIIDLLKMTHSCGFLFQNECGECYFCMEKIWATKILNIDHLFKYKNSINNR
jgi:tRNA(Ile)-lysidine synthase TilS/MesJ